MSRLKMTQKQLLQHICERLEVAQIAGGCHMFDALAMAGFELDSFKPEYWSVYSENIASIIDFIKRECIRYETEIDNEEYAEKRIKRAAENVRQMLSAYSTAFDDDSAPEQLEPIAQLFHRSFGMIVDPSDQTAERPERVSQAQKDIQRQQVLTHIATIQMQTRNALNMLEEQLQDLLKG